LFNDSDVFPSSRDELVSKVGADDASADNNNALRGIHSGEVKEQLSGLSDL
jgi:hypothetical protein